MRLLRRLTASRAVQSFLGITAAEYLRLVWNTNRIIIDPPDAYARFSAHWPVIMAMWHGQHFLTPFIRRREERAKVLVSRHRDGELNAIVARRLGIEVIRGSGAHGGEFIRKGGITAFGEMRAALDEGYTLALTADVPKVSRVAGLGIVMLARATGRPILPVAVATSRRIVLNNWDRSVINLPFGRAAVVGMEPIVVPRDADAPTLEAYRLQVEHAIDRVTDRAYEIVDKNR
jgi:lysophospholipid acyltransferase (LPLAT)-like uncharacterized protein